MPAGFQGFGNAAGYVGSVPFSPDDIADIRAWYRSDLGVTQSGTVSAWADQSGAGDAGRNLSQGTGASRPTFNAIDAEFNNHPSISGTSTQFMLSGTWSVSVSQPFTLFLVGKAPGAGSVCMCDGATAQSALIFNDTGNDKWNINSSGTTVASTESCNSVSSVIAVFSGASSKIYANAITANGSGNAGATAFGNELTMLAYNHGSFNLGGGTIAELAVFSGSLSTTERAQLMSYAHSRYGITIGP